MRIVSFAALLLCTTPLIAGPKIAIVVGPSAPLTERFAADELASQLKTLFEAVVTISDKPTAADHTILLGSPTTNPAVKDAIGDAWPKDPDKETHLLKSTPKGLVLGGASPTATLWAAYELGHHFGIRAFLHGDVYPEKAPPLKLDGIDITLKPVTKVRAWSVAVSSPLEFGAWGLEDQKKFFNQLVKLKFNAIDLRPIKPWKTITVSGDTAGRKAFRGSKVFGKPEMPDSDPKWQDKMRIYLIFIIVGVGLDLIKSEQEPQRLTTNNLLPRLELPVGANGVAMRATVPGDSDIAAYSVSRRGFTPALEGKDVVTSLYGPSLGKASAERVALGMKAIADVSDMLRKDNPESKFGTASPSLIADELLSATPPPEWWKAAREKYTEANAEMYRGIRSTYNEPARAPLLYHAKRCEFAMNYIAAMEATRHAGVAKAKGDKEATVLHLEKAIEAMYNALNAYGDVARDPGDRGVIAVLNETVYRPLKAELKAAEKK